VREGAAGDVESLR